MAVSPFWGRGCSFSRVIYEMTHVATCRTPKLRELGDRLRNAYAVTAEFLSDIIRQTAGFRPGAKRKTPRRAADPVRRLDRAALALIDLELPQWQCVGLPMTKAMALRAVAPTRIADWLDQSIEARHPIWRWHC